MSIDVKIFWKNCLKFIEDNLSSQQAYNTWFKPIKPINLNNIELTIEVPTHFFYEYIEAHYIKLLKTALYNQLGKEGKLLYRITMEHSNDSTALVRPSNHKTPPANQSLTIRPYHENSKISNPQIVPGLQSIKIDPQLNFNYTFENFVEGDSNRLVCIAGKAISTNLGNNSFNPLFVHGKYGIGKTHFANAVGLEVKEKFPEKIVLYISAEKFMQQYTTAVRNNNKIDFIHFYQQIDLLIVDDIQFLSGRKGTQEVFFHIFEHLYQNGKQLIITSDKSPVEIQDIDERLLSRFKWGLSSEIKSPGVQMRKDILKCKAFKDGITLKESIIDYIAENVNTNIRELEGVLTAIIAYSLIDKKEIGLSLVKEIISNYIKKLDKSITIEDIQKIVCKYFDIQLEDIKSKSRKRNIVQARHTSMYLAKEYTKSPFSIIGRKTGNRDHSTVLHACKTINNLISTDKKIKNYIQEIKKNIDN